MVRRMLSKSTFIFSSMYSKSLSVRPLLFQICHFPSSLNNSSLLRRHYHGSRTIPVSVWWDFENCDPPSDVNAFRITHFIMEAVRAKGIMGPLQIRAFGDVYHLTRANQDALTSTGIKIIHVPRGGKNTADRSLLIDLMYWVSQNPPPAHLFLISGDRDFAELLHRLRMNNYNILIAGIEIPNILCSVATIVWHWNSLLRGENLEGKHFNHPPDGLYGTWYGHHEAPLEDPFSDGKQSTRSHIGESPKPISGLNLRPIPKAVVRQIRQILNSHPKGISLSCLRTELEHAGITLDKDYYGYNKFSHFLLSVVRVQLGGARDKEPIAHYIPKKSPVPIKSSFAPSMELVDNEGLNHVATSMASSHELSGEDIPEVQQVADVAETKSQLPPKENEILCSSDTIQAFAESAACDIGGSTESVIAKSSGGSGETHSSTASKRLIFYGWIKRWWPFRKKVGNTHNSTAQGNEMVCNAEEPELSNLKQRVSYSEELQTLEQRQVASQFKEPELSEPRQTMNHSGEPKLFSCSSFWEEMESFVFTSKGEILVFHSRSRKDIALSFQKYGPQVLHSLSENDLLLLVDLLISEKKCLEERPSQTNPFRVIPSITTRSNSQKSSEWEVDEKQSIPHTMASSPASQKEHTEKSATDVLADVQKLVSELLTEHPDGCNMGQIPILFLQKYGYFLDVGKLGHDRLSSLVQSLPGVKTARSNFFPVNCGIRVSGNETSILKTQGTKLSDVEYQYSDNELHDSYSEDDWKDSPWEELGPVSVSNSNESDLESEPKQEAIVLKTAIDPDYEPDLSGDDSSKSGGDNSCLTQAEEEGEPKLKESDLESEPRQEEIELKTAIDPDYEPYLSDDDSSESGGVKLCLTQTEEEGQPKLNESDGNESDLESKPRGNESDLESKPRQVAVELKTAIDPDYEPDLFDDDSSESGGVNLCLTQTEEEGQPKLNESDLESKPRQEAVELKTAIVPDYEHDLSDDYFSESGGDNSCLTQSEDEGRPKLNGEDSSLQTLDPVYGSQGEDSGNPNEVNAEDDGLADGLNPPRISTPATSSEILSGDHEEQHKPLKICSLDAEPVSHKNKEMIKGILQCLKRSEDMNMPN